MAGPEQAVETWWLGSFLEIETKTGGAAWGLCPLRQSCGGKRAPDGGQGSWLWPGSVFGVWDVGAKAQAKLL